MFTPVAKNLNVISIDNYLNSDNEVLCTSWLEADNSAPSNLHLPYRDFAVCRDINDSSGYSQLHTATISQIFQNNSSGELDKCYRSWLLADINNKNLNYVKPSGSYEPVGCSVLYCDSRADSKDLLGSVIEGIEMRE